MKSVTMSPLTSPRWNRKVLLLHPTADQNVDVECVVEGVPDDGIAARSSRAVDGCCAFGEEHGFDINRNGSAGVGVYLFDETTNRHITGPAHTAK